MTTEIRSDVPEGGATPDPTAPDVGAAIDRVQARRGPGRPKGSKTRGKGKRSAAAPAEPDVPVEITETDIKGAQLLGSVSWRLIGKFFNLRELTTEESRELGEAAAPVMAKYLPEMGAYAPEIGLALTLFGLWEATKIDGPKAPEVEQLDMFKVDDSSEPGTEIAGA